MQSLQIYQRDSNPCWSQREYFQSFLGAVQFYLNFSLTPPFQHPSAAFSPPHTIALPSSLMSALYLVSPSSYYLLYLQSPPRAPCGFECASFVNLSLDVQRTPMQSISGMYNWDIPIYLRIYIMTILVIILWKAYTSSSSFGKTHQCILLLLDWIPIYLTCHLSLLLDSLININLHSDNKKCCIITVLAEHFLLPSFCYLTMLYTSVLELSTAWEFRVFQFKFCWYYSALKIIEI